MEGHYICDVDAAQMLMYIYVILSLVVSCLGECTVLSMNNKPGNCTDKLVPCVNKISGIQACVENPACYCVEKYDNNCILCIVLTNIAVNRPTWQDSTFTPPLHFGLLQ